MGEPLLSLRKVSKAYQKGPTRVEIFRDLDLVIEAGEVVSIMGPSGSGKTTLLHLMGGIDRVDAGEIMFGNEAIQDLSESQLSRWRAGHVGFIFQFYNLMPALTAAQNVEIPLLLTRLSRADRRLRVAAALDVVGLSDRAKHRPVEMSGGEQQRIAIARAIVASPSLLLADEPTGDLDRETAEEILQILEILCNEMGKTIIMVTHDHKAAAHATRLLRLDKGRFDERIAA